MWIENAAPGRKGKAADTDANHGDALSRGAFVNTAAVDFLRPFEPERNLASSSGVDPDMNFRSLRRRGYGIACLLRNREEVQRFIMGAPMDPSRLRSGRGRSSGLCCRDLEPFIDMTRLVQ